MFWEWGGAVLISTLGIEVGFNWSGSENEPSRPRQQAPSAGLGVTPDPAEASKDQACEEEAPAEDTVIHF